MMIQRKCLRCDKQFLTLTFFTVYHSFNLSIRLFVLTENNLLDLFFAASDVSDGKTHKTSITVKPSEKTISLTIDKENKLYSYRHYDPLTNVDRETSLIFGYSG